MIGLGVSGRAATSYLLSRGAIVFGSDRKHETFRISIEGKALLDRGLILIEEEYVSLQPFLPLQAVIVSPGVSAQHPLVQEAHHLQLEVVGEIQLGLLGVLQLPQRQLVGITGTNGKTTTTLLVESILQNAGLLAKAVGNSGFALTQFLYDALPHDHLVVELSSYQLEGLALPVFRAGALLNITPDHLDRYPNMEAYAEAKFQLGRCLLPQAPFFVQERAWQEFGRKTTYPLVRIFGYTPRCWMWTDGQAVWMEGKKVFHWPNGGFSRPCHDVENAMAAFALCREWGVTSEQFISGLLQSKKPPHRLEFVVEKQGVRYYDDSKGTNIDAVLRAVESIKGPIWLIAGGVDKGHPYTSWAPIFAGKVQKVLAIGQAAEKIERDVGPSTPVEKCASLREAVEKASLEAVVGGAVLLSPGCASFDMFVDYVDRGRQFQQLVGGEVS